MTQTRIGYIGLGNMGGAIAHRMLDQGAALTVFDISEQNLASFRSKNVRVATSPRDVADETDIVFSCLPSVKACFDVALGDNGVKHGKAVKVYIENSTMGVKAAQKVAKELPAHIGFIDAPVSGGPPGARAGTLTTMASGPPEHFERARPAMQLMAKHVFNVGPKNGMAQTAKLINNHLSTAGRLAAFEGLVLALKAGLDVHALTDLINVSSGRNFTTTDKIPQAILPGTFKFNGQLTISIKDETLLAEEAEELGVPLWLVPRCLETLKRAAEDGYADKDSMYVIQYMGEKAGIDVQAMMIEINKKRQSKAS